MLRDRTILVTGVTGRVARPVAEGLAGHNEVLGLARFTDASVRIALEDAGVRPVTADLVSGDLSAVPQAVDYVLNFAVVKTNSFDTDLAGNVSGLGLLMEHCRSARAFLHCSSTAVYQPDAHRRFTETDPLGDNHRVLPWLQTYSISKIAAEAMCHHAARRWELPTTIARLNVPYGANGGWPASHLDMLLDGRPIPVHVDAPSEYNPIHEDDIAGQIEGLLSIASVPPTVVNWAGADVVSIEEWCAYLGSLIGVEPVFEPTEQTLQSVAVDVEKLHRLVGPTTVHWKDGFRRMAASRRPEALQTSP